MTDDVLTPKELAAVRLTERLGRSIRPSAVVEVQPGGDCGSSVESALCLRPAGHPGEHRDFLIIDDQGRKWDTLDDQGDG